MKKSFTFLIACLIIISYSCDENSTGEYSDAKGLIPFKLNNSWEYLNIISDSSGNVIGTDTITMRIIKDTIISNIHFYKYDNSVLHLTSKQDGIWIYFISDSIEEYYLEYKYPCKTGDTYSFLYGRPPAVVSVVLTSTNVQVEAGTFSCILYRFDLDGLDSYNDIYIAPGVGIVKIEHYEARISSAIYKSSERRLISHHLN